MNTKLTLSVEDKLIRRAKKIAKKKGKSVSQMVSDYLFSLVSNENEVHVGDIPPITRSMKGVLANDGEVSERNYKDYLESKYL